MKYLIFVIILLTSPIILHGEPALVTLDPSYEHDKWITLPRDIQFDFAAYTGSFDSADDNNGDGTPDIWGIPEWVSFEIRELVIDHPLQNRPGWMTDTELFEAGIAPDDDSYGIPGANSMREVKTDYRFVRGHMCPKDTAERISRDAAYNTHMLLNAVPQLQWQNNGVWKEIEELSIDWADEFERIWVICGPVFFQKTPALWLGQDNELKVAVPDALFKIIIREDTQGGVKTISFLIPNIVPKEKDSPCDYVSTINRIEELTGLDFLTALGDDQEDFESLKVCVDEWERE